jgi:hypothetical protein
MKKLTSIIISLVFTLVCVQSHASIISLSTNQASYKVGDTVLLDISFEDLNSDTQVLGFDLNFDNTALDFDSFTSSTVLSESLIIGLNLLLVDNTITFNANWLFSSLPSASFSLGQASFIATQAYVSVFEATDVFSQSLAQEIFDIPSASASVLVPEPSAGLLMLFAFVLLPLKRKLSVKRK